MPQREIFRRHFKIQPIELRAGAEGLGELVGMAALYNSESQDLGGFVEVLAPGSFRNALGKDHEIVALQNHNQDRILGSTANGTLDLSENERGLEATMRPPDTPTGREVRTLVEGGFLRHMSFAFTVADDGDSFSVKDGRALRTITEVERLYDVSIVTSPAYMQTTVSARTLERAMKALSSSAWMLDLNRARQRQAEAE